MMNVKRICVGDDNDNATNVSKQANRARVDSFVHVYNINKSIRYGYDF